MFIFARWDRSTQSGTRRPETTDVGFDDPPPGELALAGPKIASKIRPMFSGTYPISRTPAPNSHLIGTIRGGP
jgi:hypothetical protein